MKKSLNDLGKKGGGVWEARGAAHGTDGIKRAR
jgi:hypothetical protein